ncbi:MAG: methyltransferase family protein [Candidatus Saccharimonadales bacterium]
MNSKQRRALLLPIMVAGVVPPLLAWGSMLTAGWWGWLWGTTGLVWVVLSIVTVASFIMGIFLLITTIASFTRRGESLGPWDAITEFVCEGLYRYSRNPMITGVALILLGWILWTGSLWVVFELIAFIIFQLWLILTQEEPELREKFPDRYTLYLQNVPRFWFRLHAWIPPWEQNNTAQQ